MFQSYSILALWPIGADGLATIFLFLHSVAEFYPRVPKGKVGNIRHTCLLYMNAKFSIVFVYLYALVMVMRPGYKDPAHMLHIVLCKLVYYSSDSTMASKYSSAEI
jgi:hypothetical protein